jgi:ELWxxDGT repeat protein
MGNGIPGSQTGSAQVTNMQVYGSTGAPQVAAAAANVTNASLYSVGGETGDTFSAFQYGGQGDPPSRVLFSGGGLYVTSGKPGATATNLSTNLLASVAVTNFVDKALIYGLDESFQSSLWVSDGTPAGTNELSKLTIPSSAYPYFTVVSALKKAFFWCEDPSESVQLCVTDGTAAGTLQLTSVSGGASELPVPAIAVLADEVLFPGLTSTGYNDLWVSDGTIFGTFPLTNTSINPSNVVVSDGIGYFSATTMGQPNNAIWESNGSSVGTYVLDPTIDPYLITPVAGGVAFVGFQNDVSQLYKSDGTLSGTIALGGTDPQTIAAFGSQILFGDFSLSDHANELFLSTGEPGGITQLTNSNTAPGFNGAARFFSILGNQMLFADVDENVTLSLWATNGSVAGTEQLASSTSSFGLSPGSMVVAGERAFFVGYDPSDEQQLWVTNGTSEGTLQLTSSSTGAVSLGPVLFGSKVLFVSGDFDLLVSNGTTKGTLKVTSGGNFPITTITVLPN